MAHTVIMPKAGQTMEEGTIVQWIKQEGDAVQKGDPLMVIQTDKADLEVESTGTGIVRKILVQEGDTVPVLQAVAVITDPDETIDLDAFLADEQAAAPAAPSAPAAAPKEPTPAAPAPAAAEAAASPRATPAARKVAELENVDLTQVKGTGVSGRIMRDDVLSAREGRRIVASPYARKLAREGGLDLASIRGTGPDGRIIKRDVEEAIARAPAPAAAPAAEGEVEVVELTGMRKAIAGALQQSKQQAPHFYATGEVDVTRALAFKDYLKETGRKISVNDLVLRAAVLALGEHRRVNCRVEGNRITYVPTINLGVAVGLEEGLVVPVVVNAGRLSLTELAQESRRIADLARQGKLIGTGQGTFTVTNLGMFGVESFAAIINPPEAAILAVGAAKDTIVVKDQTFSLRKTMKLTLSVDHRVVDGVVAAKFLNTLKEALENPESLS